MKQEPQWLEDVMDYEGFEQAKTFNQIRKWLPDTDDLHHHGPNGRDAVPFDTFTIYIVRRWIEGKNPRARAIGKYCVYCGLIPTERTLLLKAAADETVRDAERRALRRSRVKRPG